MENLGKLEIMEEKSLYLTRLYYMSFYLYVLTHAKKEYKGLWDDNEKIKEFSINFINCLFAGYDFIHFCLIENKSDRNSLLTLKELSASIYEDSIKAKDSEVVLQFLSQAMEDRIGYNLDSYYQENIKNIPGEFYIRAARIVIEDREEYVK